MARKTRGRLIFASLQVVLAGTSASTADLLRLRDVMLACHDDDGLPCVDGLEPDAETARLIEAAYYASRRGDVLSEDDLSRLASALYDMRGAADLEEPVAARLSAWWQGGQYA